MNIDWLVDVPIIAWIGLAAIICIGILVISIIVGNRRSQEVDELQKAFGDPYDYPEEEGEKLGQKRKSKAAQRAARSQAREKKDTSKQVISTEESTKSGPFTDKEPLSEQKVDEDPSKVRIESSQPADQEVEKKVEKPQEVEEDSEVPTKHPDESRPTRVNRSRVHSTNREPSAPATDDQEGWEKVRRDWESLSTEPLPSRGSRHGRNRRSLSAKKPGRKDGA